MWVKGFTGLEVNKTKAKAHAHASCWFQITLKKEHVCTAWLESNNLKNFVISHDSKNKHICLQLIAHALWNWQVLYHVVRNWLSPIKLQYNVNLWADFNLKKSENFSIWKANLNQHLFAFQYDGLKTTYQSFWNLSMFYLCQDFTFYVKPNSYGWLLLSKC